MQISDAYVKNATEGMKTQIDKLQFDGSNNLKTVIPSPLAISYTSLLNFFNHYHFEEGLTNADAGNYTYGDQQRFGNLISNISFVFHTGTNLTGVYIQTKVSTTRGDYRTIWTQVGVPTIDKIYSINVHPCRVVKFCFTNPAQNTFEFSLLLRRDTLLNVGEITEA